MTSVRRWALVVLGTLLVIGIPLGIRSLPAAGSDISAAQLLTLVKGSQDRSWSGFVDTDGNLGLPDTSGLDDVADLFSGRTRMRVWWQSKDAWRIDQITPTGEHDLIGGPDTATEFDYEENTVDVLADLAIRLPRAADLIPPSLGHRAVQDATSAQVRRIGSERVAGIDAPGLRITPASADSSIDHVDLWADPGTGVPLRVAIYPGHAGAPSLTTSFRDFTSGSPDPARVAATLSPNVESRRGGQLDIAGAAAQYAPIAAPRTVLGLANTLPQTDSAVGVYGSGLTQLIAIPLRDKEADALRDQLATTPGVTQGQLQDAPGSAGDDRESVVGGSVGSVTLTSVQIGILGVVLTGAPGQGGFLVAGTLDTSALDRAAADVLAGFSYTRER